MDPYCGRLQSPGIQPGSTKVPPGTGDDAMNKPNIGCAMGLAAVLALAFAPAALAGHGPGRYGHGGHYGGHYGHGYYGHGGYGHYRGHYSGGRWIAGAIVTGALIGLVADATAPRTYYYEQPRVVYRQPTVVYRQPRVVYEQAPVVVERRVYQPGVVYTDPYGTRYIRDDGYDGQ
jgi:hypothetical protein